MDWRPSLSSPRSGGRVASGSPGALDMWLTAFGLGPEPGRERHDADGEPVHEEGPGHAAGAPAEPGEDQAADERPSDGDYNRRRYEPDAVHDVAFDDGA